MAARLMGPLERMKEQGDDMYKIGMFEGAIAAYTTCIETGRSSGDTGPTVISALNNRAASHKQLSNFNGTIEDCTSVLEVEPENVKALVRRAQAFEALERYKLALQDAKFVISLGEDGAGMQNYKLCNQMQGRLQDKQEEDVRVLLLGIEESGKTTALYHLKLDEVVTTIPTVGFNVEKVEHEDVIRGEQCCTKMCIWDVGGQDKIRPLWRHYFTGSKDEPHMSHCIAFAFDCSGDAGRLAQQRDVLHTLLAEPAIAGHWLLLLANKQDVAGAMRAPELEEFCGLLPGRCPGSAAGRPVHVQECCATTGQGLRAGLRWVARMFVTKGALDDELGAAPVAEETAAVAGEGGAGEGSLMAAAPPSAPAAGGNDAGSSSDDDFDE